MPSECTDQELTDRAEVRVRLGDLRLLLVTDDQHADIGMIGELIEVAGDPRLTEQGERLRCGMPIRHDRVRSALPTLRLHRKDAGPDIGAERHARGELLQRRALFLREAKGQRRPRATLPRLRLRGLLEGLAEAVAVASVAGPHGDGSVPCGSPTLEG